MRFNLTPVVTNLLILNVLVLIIDSIIPIDLNQFLGIHYFESSNFYPFQFFTYMFAHSNLMHLLGNMLGLVVFGSLLEEFWGSKRFLFFYIFTGVGAAALHLGIRYWEIIQLKEAVSVYLAEPTDEAFYVFIADNARYLLIPWEKFIEAFQDNPQNPEFIAEGITRVKAILDSNLEIGNMVGASGAVMGVVTAFALLFPNTELFLLFLPFPIKAKYIALAYIASDVYGIIKDAPDDNVARFAHIGGVIFAFIIVQYWKTRRDTFY